MSINNSMTETAEHLKAELSLSLNSYNAPTEYVNHKAWANLIMQLVLLEPGTYPSTPDMGVGLGNYNFEDIGTYERIILNDIKSQISKYLSSIPIEDIVIDTRYSKSTGTYVVFLFSFSEDGETSNVAVVATQKGKLINFEVSL